MKISLISTKDTQIKIFPELGKVLGRNISGLELEARYVPFTIDLPFVALECAKESDFIIVFAMVEDEDEADYIKKKLIDVELASETRILKAVDVDSVSGLDDSEFDEEKARLIDELSKTAISILFKERDFESKDAPLVE
jgi:hypothetical protein